MKYLLLCILVASLSSCRTSSNETENEGSRNTPTNLQSGNLSMNQNSGVSVQIDSLAPTNDQETAEIDKLKERQRRDAERVPEEFREIDFKNFSYTSFLTGESFT